jgi:hypothetical protein
MKAGKRTAQELAVLITAKAAEFQEFNAEHYGRHVPETIAVEEVLKRNPALAREWYATPELRALYGRSGTNE